MRFSHADEIWRDYPELVAGAMLVQGVTGEAAVDEQAKRFTSIAASRLAGRTEAELPEIQAWRRTFSRMGLKPTQYRCAAESLLRRFKKEGALPRIHPVIDLCNALSLAFAIPIAVFDVANVADYLEVRHAAGSEDYLAFSGEIEHPEPREVIFADSASRAHARRWTYRQSAASAVRPDTAAVLVVAEAMHGTASSDVQRLMVEASVAIETIWHTAPRAALLSAGSPRFEW